MVDGENFAVLLAQLQHRYSTHTAADLIQLFPRGEVNSLGVEQKD
jgi:hypothetical protein